MKLDSLPRLRLAHLPTPLEAAPRLSAALGGPRILLKRDDLSGLGLGGNKARKLEFLLADAQQQGATAVITVGGLQSNHCRITAAAAAKVGLTCHLVLTLPWVGDGQGSVFIDAILGARVHKVESRDRAAIEAKVEAVAAKLRADGERPYLIPVGGSNPIGSSGYVLAMRELAEQCAAAGVSPKTVVHASGSAGTQAGTEVGQRLFLPNARVMGVAVSRPTVDMQPPVAALAQATADFLGVAATIAPGDIQVDDRHYGPAYGVLTDTGVEAIALTARTEGVILDPVYSGKAMAGLIAQIREGRYGRDDVVVFLHTGGVPALFAYNEGITTALAGRPIMASAV